MTLDEFNALQSPEALAFLREYSDLKPNEFALKFASRKELPIRAMAEQLSCAFRAAKKFPTLHTADLIYTKRSIEQCSSEFTARLKRFYLKGKTLADLTGGLGIDSIFSAEQFEAVHYCERELLLGKIASRNFGLLGKTISVHEGDGIDFLKSQKNNSFDWIYLDPDRRDKNASRKIDIEDYEPNLIAHEALLLEKAAEVMVKVSPMVDLTRLRHELQSLDEFVVVSVDNECKEVWLILRRKRHFGDVRVKALCYNSRTDKTFHIEKEQFQKFAKVSAPMPQTYFIEPDRAIIKARLSDKFAEKHNLSFINENCDYLTSTAAPQQLPCRAFTVVDVLPYKKKTVSNYLKANGITRATVARRNFPDSPDFLRKMFKLKEGDGTYLFFTKNSRDEHIAIVATRL